MTSVEKLKDIGDKLMTAAKENLIADKHLQRVVFFIADGVIVRIAALVGNAETQDFADQIFSAAQATRADAVMMICDSWVAVRDVEEGYIPQKGDAENDPNRAEAIVLSARGPHVELINTWIYKRREDVIEFELPDSGWHAAEINTIPKFW